MKRLVTYLVIVVAIALGLSATFGCAYVQRGLTPFAEMRSSHGVFRVKGVSEKIVVLTIDDGPSSRTPELLDLLDEYNATATFFVHTAHADSLAGGDQMVADMVRRGHEVGNHMTTDTPTAELTKIEFHLYFLKAHYRLRDIGIEPVYFRASRGFFDYEKNAGSTLADLDYSEHNVLASFYPWDTWLPFPNWYANQVSSGVYPGAIVVFHDGEHKGKKRAERMLVSVRKFLENMKEKGYHTVSLSEAFALAGEEAVTRVDGTGFLE